MINGVMQVHGSYMGAEETRASHLSVVHRSTFSGGRSVEPFSTGPVAGLVRTALVFDLSPSLSLLFFFFHSTTTIAVSSQGFAVLKFRRDRRQFSKTE